MGCERRHDGSLDDLRSKGRAGQSNGDGAVEPFNARVWELPVATFPAKDPILNDLVYVAVAFCSPATSGDGDGHRPLNIFDA